ncbi:hypothetical protein SUDANB91_07043 [Streptomyces sp. SudanB91_2054]
MTTFHCVSCQQLLTETPKSLEKDGYRAQLAR